MLKRFRRRKEESYEKVILNQISKKIKKIMKSSSSTNQFLSKVLFSTSLSDDNPEPERFSEKDLECVELCKKYLFHRSRIFLETGELKKSVSTLIYLDHLLVSLRKKHFGRIDSTIRVGQNKKVEYGFLNEEYGQLKQSIFDGVFVEAILLSKLRDFSWVEEVQKVDSNPSHRIFFDQLFLKWDEFVRNKNHFLNEMKTNVMKIIQQYFDRMFFSSGGDHNHLSKFQLYVSDFSTKLFSQEIGDDLFLDQDDLFVANKEFSKFDETRKSLKNEFDKYFEGKILDGSKNPQILRNVYDDLFRDLENDYFVTNEDIRFLSLGGNQLKLKYFGLNWKNYNNILIPIGYGLIFKEFSSGGFIIKNLKKRNSIRPVFYGKVRQEIHPGGDNSRRVFIKNGEKCKDFSIKDGSLIYEGSFVNGKREGKGIEYTAIGKSNLGRAKRMVFEGKFLNNKRNGRGESIDPETGIVSRGRWINGKLDENSVFKFDCPIIRYNEIKKNLMDSKAIGKGANGVVYIVKTSSFSFLKSRMKKYGVNQPHVAVKIMKTRNRMENNLILQLIRRGIGLCYSIRSKHILETYGIVSGGKEVGYVMELCEKSIYDMIGEEEISLKEKIRIIKETALGMKALHSRNVMHRDLKWSNVMRGYDGVVKLTDFDTLKEDEHWRLQTMSQSSNIGTPGFRPPEVYNGKEYTLKCDVYAFGLMIYSALWEKKFPYITQFQCSCGVLMADMVRNNRLEEHVAYCNLRPILYPEEVRKYPEFLIELMIQCWDASPFNRPTFEEILIRFDLEDRKQFSKICLKFPNHTVIIPNQKMFLTKPYERKKIIEWVEKKFNPHEPKKNEEDDEKEIDSSSINYLDDEEIEVSEESEIRKRIEVSVISHSVIGTVHSEEDIEKIVENEKSPTFEVQLTNVDESFLAENDIFGGGRRKKISVEEVSKMKRKYELEIHELKRKDLENQDRIRSLEKFKEENERLKDFLRKNQILKDFYDQCLEKKKKEEEEVEGED